MDYDKRIIDHIRKRNDIEYEFYSIRKILEWYDVGMYTVMCCNRISDNKKIDGKDVCIDFNDLGNLIVNYRGFAKCQKIISSYIPENICDEIFEAFFNRADVVNSQNNILQLLRSGKTSDLFKVLKSSKNIFFAEESKKMILLAREELYARSILNKLLQKVKSIAQYYYIRLKWNWVFDMLKRYAEETK